MTFRTKRKCSPECEYAFKLILDVFGCRLDPTNSPRRGGEDCCRGMPMMVPADIVNLSEKPGCQARYAKNPCLPHVPPTEVKIDRPFAVGRIVSCRDADWETAEEGIISAIGDNGVHWVTLLSGGEKPFFANELKLFTASGAPQGCDKESDV